VGNYDSEQDIRRKNNPVRVLLCRGPHKDTVIGGPSNDIPSLTFLKGSYIIELHNKGITVSIPTDKQHLL
jgi:hypothetical protein